ncbi:MAG: protein phosphatase 2C domain-containing protein [Polyangiaceae bacterium]
METLVHAASLRPRVEVASRTDPGRDPDKQVNEDAFAYRPTPFGHLLVVCDGMGGHHAGEEASNLALRTVIETVESAPLDAPARAVLAHAVRTANERVYGLAPPDVAGRPGSTIVLALVQASGAVLAHVGDSRCYLLRQGHSLALTRDHSVVQQMVDQGMITAEQAIGHPDANRILRALGVIPNVDVEVRPDNVPFAAGDTFLLCSDGLTDLVMGPEIARVVHEAPTLEAAASRLVDLANERGGHDNITVLAMRAFDDATTQAAPTVVGTPPPGPVTTLQAPAAPMQPQPMAPMHPMAPQGSYAPTPPMGQAPMHGPMGQPTTPMGPAPMGPAPMGHGSIPYTPGPMPAYVPPPPPTPSSPQGYASGPSIVEPPYSQPTVPPSRAPRRGGGEGGLLVAGIVLAVLGVVVIGGIGAVLWFKHHPHTKTPAFVEAGVPDAGATVIPPTPTLDTTTPPPEVPPLGDDASIPTPAPSAEPAPTSPRLHRGPRITQ